MPRSMDPRAIVAREIRDQSLVPDALLSPEELASYSTNVMNVPQTCGKLTDEEIDLTANHDAVALVQMLQAGQVTAAKLLYAFRKRATIAQQLTNCITELLPEAQQAAERCDKFVRDNGKLIGPLHGLPVSVKEQFGIANRFVNCSFVAWAGHRAGEDCDLVKVLKSLGAVVFARTNQPQAVMHLECSNSIYGTCVSPFDRSKSSGGSSGGEAALLALRGTVFGFGGDIGGSIRAPAAFNGVYGFKPTASIVSSQGVTGILAGADSILGSLGPFTRSKRDLDLILLSYSSFCPWKQDPSLSRFKFEAFPPTPHLTIGILEDPSLLKPSDAVTTVLDTVIERIGNHASITLLPFRGFEHDKVWPILQPLYFEGCEGTVEAVIKEGNEPLHSLTKWILSTGSRENLSNSELQALKAARNRYRKDYSDYWNSTGVDVVLSAVYQDTAPPPNTSTYWMYTAIWNLLDYPAVSFPASALVGVAHSSSADSPTMPVGLQLIAKRWMDNELLAALDSVVGILQS